MNISNIKNYTVDTEAAIRSAAVPAAGNMAFSSDTNTLFVSDGTTYRVMTHSTNNSQYVLSGNTYDSTPYMHLDASDSTSLELTAEDEVTRWYNKTGGEHLSTTQGATNGTYLSSDANGNAVVCLSGSDSLMSIDPACRNDARTGDLTMFIVFTPSDDPQFKRPTGAAGQVANYRVPPAGNTGSALYRFTTDNIVNVTYSRSFQMFFLSPSNQNHYWYSTGNDGHHIATFPTHSETPESKKATYNGTERNVLDIYNDHFLGKPHVYVCTNKLYNNLFGSERYLTTHSVQSFGAFNFADHPSEVSQKHIRYDTPFYANDLVLGYTKIANMFGYHEIIIFNSLLSNTQINKTAKNLHDKWNVAKYNRF